MSRLALLLVVAVVVLGGLLLYSQSRTEPAKVSGFVEADEIRVGSRVGGRVQKVTVQEGQAVERDVPLVELEPFDLRERQAEAKAELARLKARLAELENGPRKQELEAGRARVKLAKAQLELAQENHKRVETLFGRNVATREEMDRANEQLRVATAEMDVRTAELALLEEGTRSEAIDQGRAAVAAAEASLAAIDRQLEELVIRAPVAGVIEALELQPGDLVGANAPVLSMLDTGSLWVRAYVPENRLDLQVGDKLAVTIDSYPGERFTGTVTFISRQAEFTPSNVQTPEDRSNQVFRIKVTFGPEGKRLRPGMSADVWLDSKQK